MNGHWRLLEQNMANVLKPGSFFLIHLWGFQGALTVAEDCYVFPLFHPDFPTAVNYGGAGRLIAYEVLRGLVHSHLYFVSTLGNEITRRDEVSQSNSSLIAAVDRSPHLVHKNVRPASLIAFRLISQRGPRPQQCIHDKCRALRRTYFF
ncbi:hypothetical protein MRX96_058372 [Rhipicephalus microplus]